MTKLFLLLSVSAYLSSAVYLQSIQRLPIWCIDWLIAINVVSFICYGIDKLAAIKQWQRTPEKHFYVLALLSGWSGSVLGQMLFNHKTTKQHFRRRFYFMSIMNICLVCSYLYQDHIILLLN